MRKVIKEKVIIFGYGTTLIHGSWYSSVLTISSIYPPKEIGLEITDSESYETIETVKFKYEADMLEFYNQVKMLSEDNPIIKFREYTFDFTKFNKKSVKVLKNKLDNVIQGHMMLLACQNKMILL